MTAFTQTDSKSSSHAFCYYHSPYDRFPGWNTFSCNALLLPAPGTSIFSESLKAESDWGMQSERESGDSRKSHYNFYDRSISKWNYISLQWITWYSFVQFFSFLSKTFRVSRSVLKKNTFNQNLISTRKMKGLVILFFTTKCRCTVQEDMEELLWKLQFYRGLLQRQNKHKMFLFTLIWIPLPWHLISNTFYILSCAPTNPKGHEIPSLASPLFWEKEDLAVSTWL